MKLTKVKKDSYQDEVNKNVYYYEITDKNGNITHHVTQGFKSIKEVKSYFEEHGKLPKILSFNKYNYYGEFEITATNKNKSVSHLIEKFIKKMEALKLDNKESNYYISCDMTGTSLKNMEGHNFLPVDSMQASDVEDVIISIHMNNDDFESNQKKKLLEKFIQDNKISRQDLKNIINE